MHSSYTEDGFEDDSDTSAISIKTPDMSPKATERKVPCFLSPKDVTLG